ncbi:MAG: PAS domain-containing protein, partial [Candidatus Firestonebacteria bacterium]
ISSIEDGTYIKVNKGFSVLTGYSEEETLGKSSTKSLRIWKNAGDRSRLLAELKEKSEVNGVEIEILTKKGETRITVMSGRFIDFLGKKHFLTIVRDITEAKNKEKILLGTKEQLALAVSGSGIGLWDWRVPTGEVILNDNVAGFLGYSGIGKIPGRSEDFEELCNPEDLKKAKEILNKHFSKATEVFVSEIRVKHKSSYWVWLLVSGKVNEWDRDGNPVRMTGTIIDIAKRNDAALRQRLLAEIFSILNRPVSLDSAFKSISEGIDRELDINSIRINLEIGADLPFFDGKGIANGFEPEKKLQFEVGETGSKRENLSPKMKNLCALVFSGKTDPSNPLFTKYGSAYTKNTIITPELPEFQDPGTGKENNRASEVYLSFAIVPIRAEGKTLGLLQLYDRRKYRFGEGVVEDLENLCSVLGVWILRKQAEAALLRSEVQLKKAEEIGKTGSWEYDLETNKLTWSDEVFRIYGRDRSSGVPTLEEAAAYYSAEDDKKLKELAAEAFKTGLEFECEFNIKQAGGKILTARSIIAPTENEKGRITKLFGIVQDITERKMLEQQLAQSRKMDALGNLTAGIAHDFNNMLSIIIGYSDIAQSLGSAEGEIKESIQEIRKAAEKAAALTSQLMVFSRKQPISKKILSLNDPLHEIKSLLERVIGEDIKLEFHLFPGLKNINADKTQLEKVVLNLATNSKKAMPKGGRLTLKTENVTLVEQDSFSLPGARAGEFVCLSVSDTGFGISPELMEHLYEPFYATESFGRGSGLGLSIVFGIVNLLNGWINVISNPGKGTEFRIYLPVAKDRQNASAPKENIMENNIKVGGKKILLVEDEIAILNMVASILEKDNHIIFKAKNAEEALAFFKEEKGRFDLLFSDSVMPGMNGFELAAKLKELNPALKVIISSGYIENKAGTE